MGNGLEEMRFHFSVSFPNLQPSISTVSCICVENDASGAYVLAMGRQPQSWPGLDELRCEAGEDQAIINHQVLG